MKKSKRRHFWRRFRIIVGILDSVGLIVLGPTVISWFPEYNYAAAIYTGMVPGFMVTLVFNEIVSKHNEETLRDRLIRNFGSPSNDIALAAASELGALGYLSDGSLSGRDFMQADLKKSHLEDALFYKSNFMAATFEYAWLDRANFDKAWLVDARFGAAMLKGASLKGAFLGNAQMQYSQLEGADLRGADLSGADLHRANLKNADLTKANLSGVNFRSADLTGVVIDHTAFSTTTILPNGDHFRQGYDIGVFVYPSENG